MALEGTDAAAAKAAEAEHSIAIVRALVIAFNSVVYGAFLQPQGIPWLAWTIIGAANLYALYVIVGRPYARFPAMTTSAFTVATDGVLITLWLVATGGIESPFYLLWYLSLVAVAFRYDARGTVVAAIVYSVAYLGIAAAGDFRSEALALGIRIGYILLVGVLGALLADASSRAISERAALEDDLARFDRFRILADSTSEGLLIHQQGRILDVNTALCAMLGQARERLVGAFLTDLVSPESLPAVVQRLQRPSEEVHEMALLRPDGSTLPVSASGKELPLGEGEVARIVAFRDLSQEVEAERARREARDREAELERLRELDRMRTTFINTAAHELNTPLTPIRLQLHMLRNAGWKRDPKEERVLEMLDRNLQRLARLVRDMLDVSRLQEGRLRLTRAELDLSDTALQAVETFRYQAEAHKVRLQSDVAPGLVVWGDRERIEQVLVNLVSNALRFTPAGGKVTVSARQEGDTVLLAVADTGVGMTKAQRANLFQPFSQQHTDHNTSGLGLGLYISQGIVEGHGGTIEVASPGEGRGTTVTVRLPVRPPPEAGPPRGL